MKKILICLFVIITIPIFTIISVMSIICAFCRFIISLIEYTMDWYVDWEYNLIFDIKKEA